MASGTGPCQAPCRAISLAGGKRDNDLILPINSSLSVTLHQDQVGVGSGLGSGPSALPLPPSPCTGGC
uniref:Uncharacterized protein n=1 Tax=Bubo bubo TaxID=30461 RepID=A0A8C0F9S2_BUBBB